MQVKSIQPTIQKEKEQTVQSTQETPLTDQVVRNAVPPLYSQGWPVLGTITDIDTKNRLWVHFPGAPAPQMALAGVELGDEDIGRQCIVSFLYGDLKRPVITNLVHEPNNVPERIKLCAHEEVVIQCGNARINLSEGGRAELRGSTVVSHSSGLNRVRGASVKIN